jgi:UDP-glucose 4-epimerase
MNILVTGGLGYIGSHACVALLDEGHEVVIVDNLSNSKRDVEGGIARITGKAPTFSEGDIRDEAFMRKVFERHRFDAVMHFAGLKAVGESVAQPTRYYDNNVHGSLVLLEAMRRAQVHRLVFSSSATVYGDPASLPIKEDFPLQVTNPYGRSKLMVEDILRDLAHAEPAWSLAILRYFNPVGAHESGIIGEDPNGPPNNLLPYVAQVAAGVRPEVSVFGNDYPTPDGTGVRDYIHVVDLVLGHLAALTQLAANTGVFTYNLGTGRGLSVLDLIREFERASGRKVAYRIVARRPGDVAACYADPSRAGSELGWRAERDVVAMCRDAWKWQQHVMSR